MELDLREIFTATMVLFAVIDIVGSIPIIIDLRNKVGHIHSEKASIVACIMMIAFLFVGETILSLIGIDINSFAVAGSFVLFFLALEMILGIKLYRDEQNEATSIVPIAFPLIAGAGTMTTILSIRAEYQTINIIIAIILNIIFIPIYGFMASAWISLIAYTVMMVLSYLLGQKNYPIPYHIKQNLSYLGVSAVLVWCSFVFFKRDLIIGNIIFILFGLIILYLERATIKKIISN